MNNKILMVIIGAILCLKKENKMTKKDLADIQEMVAALNMEKPDENSNLMKIIAGIFATVVTGAIFFSSSFIYTSNAKISEIGTQLVYMSKTVDELKKKSDDVNGQYVSRADYNTFTRDTQKNVDRLRTDENVITTDLEGRVRALEQKKK